MSENELIAEFMERKYPDGNVHIHYPFKYNTSWDWIMPVIERIENMMFQVEIHTAYTNINGEDEAERKYNQDSCFESPEETKLDVTHRAIVRFLKWYYEYR